MKKAFSLVLVMLVLVMAFSVCTSAATTDPKLATLEQSVYYTGVSYTATEAMTIDGRIEEAEGWVCITPDFAEKSAMSGEYRFTSWKEDASITASDEAMLERTSDLKFYVAQTETDIYFAIEDFAPYFEVDGEDGFTKACESLCRNFYSIRLGFDVANYDRFVYIREANSLDQFNICGPDGYKNMKSVYGDIVSYTFARFAEDGTHLYDGNKNTTNQHYWVKPATKWTGVLEIKLSKAMIKDMYVEYFGEGADASIDFSSMYVSASTGGSIADPAESNKYSWSYAMFGTYLTPEQATELSLTEKVIPALVVFGADPSKAPVTEVTDAATEHVPGDEQPPVSTAADASDESEDIAEDNGSSCLGSVSLYGIALLTSLGACAALIAKKKEN